MMKYDEKAIVERIRKRVEELGGGRQRVADEMNIGRSSVDKYLTGSRMVASMIKVAKIAQALRWSPNDLVGVSSQCEPRADLLKKIATPLFEHAVADKAAAPHVAAALAQAYVAALEYGPAADEDEVTKMAIRFAISRLRNE